MKNRISQVVKMTDGEKYIIAKQAVYKGEVYYVISKLSDDEQEILDEVKLVKEVSENEKIYFDMVTDVNLVNIILNHLGIN